jgi:hypothetical protein
MSLVVSKFKDAASNSSRTRGSSATLRTWKRLLKQYHVLTPPYSLMRVLVPMYESERMSRRKY